MDLLVRELCMEMGCANGACERQKLQHRRWDLLCPVECTVSTARDRPKMRRFQEALARKQTSGVPKQI